jgi:hypothetical protein
VIRLTTAPARCLELLGELRVSPSRVLNRPAQAGILHLLRALWRRDPTSSPIWKEYSTAPDGGQLRNGQ